jgi:hypothetical protein
MTEADVPNIDPMVVKKLPFWRWISDDYISQGKVSVLAIIEIALAFYVYYFWLIPYTNWPWFTIISFLSVPLLLLRSDASIQRGVELLHKSWTKSDFAIHEKWIIRGIAFISSSGLGYWLAETILYEWLTTSSGWLHALRITFTVIAAGGIGAALSGLILGVGILSTTPILDETIKVATTGAVAGAFVGAIEYEALAIAACIAGSVAVAIVLAKFRKILVILIFPNITVGMSLHCIWLRLQATLPLWRDGLSNFSHNWYETILVADSRLAPALMPCAGNIDVRLNVASMPKGDGSHFDTIAHLALTLSFTAAAILYRWNIKANAWIWLPMAYLLRPVKWERHPLSNPDFPPDSRRKVSAFWSNRYVVTVMSIVCSVLISYLLYPYFDADIQKKLSAWAPLLVKYLPIEKVGIRYVLLWLFAFSLVIFLFFAVKLKSDYYKILEEHDKHQKLPSDLDKSIELVFEADAKRFVRLRWFAVTSLILFTYSILLQIFILKWPDTVGKAIWSWLRNTL